MHLLLLSFWLQTCVIHCLTFLPPTWDLLLPSWLSPLMMSLWSSRQLLSKFQAEVLVMYKCVFWSGWRSFGIHMLTNMASGSVGGFCLVFTELVSDTLKILVCSPDQHSHLASDGMEGLRWGLGYGTEERMGCWNFLDKCRRGGGSITWSSGCWPGLWGKRELLSEVWTGTWWPASHLEGETFNYSSFSMMRAVGIWYMIYGTCVTHAWVCVYI